MGSREGPSGVMAENWGRIKFIGTGAGGTEVAGGEAEGEAGGNGENNGDDHDEEDGIETGDGLGWGRHGASCRWELYRRLVVKRLND